MSGTNFTERDIKRALDGTFTRIQADGTLKTVEVPVTYVPGHVGREQVHRREMMEAAPLKAPGERWTAEEDDMIVRLVNQRYTYASIGRKLGRTHSALQNRVYGLRKLGRLD